MTEDILTKICMYACMYVDESTVCQKVSIIIKINKEKAD